MLFCSCHRCRVSVGGGVTSAPADAGTGGGGIPALPNTPDSALAKACAAYLASVSNPIMIGHCMRAYFFAQALAKKGNLKPDSEVLYVSCLFHDLGLEAQFDGPGDFETNGAKAAKAFLKNQAAPEVLTADVAQAIELHTDLATANHARAEFACLHMGTMMDVFGARLDQIDRKFIQQVVAEYPRTGTKTLIADLLKRQIDAKPTSKIGLMGGKVDIPARVHAAPFAD